MKRSDPFPREDDFVQDSEILFKAIDSPSPQAQSTYFEIRMYFGNS